MANPITHVYIAKRVLETLPMQIREETELYKDAFLFGSGGPDFLFALRQINDKQAALFADAMHYSNVYDVFAALSQYVTNTNNEFAKYFTLGLLCHYVVDYKFHGYVNFLVEEVLAKHIPGNQVSGIHNLIESAIDTHIVTEVLKYRNPNEYNPAKNDFKVYGDTKKAIAKLFTDVISPTLQIPITKTKVKFAIAGFRKTMDFATDKSGIKRKYFSNLEEKNTVGKKTVRNLLREPEFYKKVDYLNFSRVSFRPIRNRDDSTSVSTAMEILKESMPLCRTYIEKFLGSIGRDKKLDKSDFILNYQSIDTSRKKSIFSFFSFY